MHCKVLAHENMFPLSISDSAYIMKYLVTMAPPQRQTRDFDAPAVSNGTKGLSPSNTMASNEGQQQANS